MKDLSEKAMLVKLSISQWSGKKLDRTATADVHAQHKAGKDAGKYSKNLVGKAALKEIQRAANSARTFHYENSLPWNDSGFRILPAANFNKYSDEIRALKSEFQTAVMAFLADYPRFVEAAKHELGTLFRASEYPLDHEIAREFGFETEIQPLPAASDFRVNIRSQEADEIRRQIEGKVASNIESAQRDLWQRLFDAVSHMAAKLSDADAIFRDSLVGNLCDLCGLLPALNITEDQRLEEMRREVETRLCAFEPQQLRDNVHDRATAAREADAIADLMAGYMGVN